MIWYLQLISNVRYISSVSKKSRPIIFRAVSIMQSTYFSTVLLLVLIYEQFASNDINEMYLFSQSFPVGLKWNITSIKATTYPTLLLGGAIRTQ